MKADLGLIERLLKSAHTQNLVGIGTEMLRVFYALAMIASVVAFIINITKLSQSGDNPMKREMAIKGIMTAGICIAVLGSLGIVFLILITFI